MHQLDILCKLTSKMRTTSLQGTTEMSQCVHYSEVPLYYVPIMQMLHALASSHYANTTCSGLFPLCKCYMLWPLPIMQMLHALASSHYANATCSGLFPLCKYYMLWPLPIMHALASSHYANTTCSGLFPLCKCYMLWPLPIMPDICPYLAS